MYNITACICTWREVGNFVSQKFRLTPVSSEISEILFVSYFASQSKRIKFGDYFFDVGYVNSNVLVKCQIPTISYSTGITISTEKYCT